MLQPWSLSRLLPVVGLTASDPVSAWGADAHTHAPPHPLPAAVALGHLQPSGPLAHQQQQQQLLLQLQEAEAGSGAQPTMLQLQLELQQLLAQEKEDKRNKLGGVSSGGGQGSGLGAPNPLDPGSHLQLQQLRQQQRQEQGMYRRRFRSLSRAQQLERQQMSEEARRAWDQRERFGLVKIKEAEHSRALRTALVEAGHGPDMAAQWSALALSKSKGRQKNGLAKFTWCVRGLGGWVEAPVMVVLVVVVVVVVMCIWL